jgi:peptide-methionine (S)-S-oxide reductase
MLSKTSSFKQLPMRYPFAQVLLLALFFVACSSTPHSTQTAEVARTPLTAKDTAGMQIAYLAGGCFWKMDACYQQLKGVSHVEVGFAGGHTDKPTYEQVGTRTTGHAETVMVVFDPKIITYKEILEVFWTIHDPTVLNREGNDSGDDYRSEIMYTSEEQRKTAEEVKAEILKSGQWSKIVTTILPFKNYYKAEEYHQNYYNLHKSEGYCAGVVAHKVEIFENKYKAKMK